MTLWAVTLNLLLREYCCTVNIFLFSGNLIIYSFIKHNVTSFFKKYISKYNKKRDNTVMFIGTNTVMMLYDDSALNFNFQLRRRLAEVPYSYLGVHSLIYRTGDPFFEGGLSWCFLAPLFRHMQGRYRQLCHNILLPRPLI